MAVLVTGVGYIGAPLVERLLAAGEAVVAVDNFFSTDPAVIERFTAHERFHFIEGDVSDPQVMRRAFSLAPISVVYSLAAQASASLEAAPARYTEETNLIAPRVMLDLMLEFDVPTVVYGSSFKVYGGDLPLVVTEETPYGRFGDLSHLSKCYAEKLLEMYAGNHRLNCYAIRLGIVYGLGPLVKQDYRFMTAPNKFGLQAVRGERIELYPGYDRPAGFIHLTDAVDVMLAAGRETEHGGYLAVNAVTEMLSVAQVAQIVAEAARARGLRVGVKPAEALARPVVADVPVVRSRFERFFAAPRRGMANSMGEMLTYFQGNS